MTVAEYKKLNPPINHTLPTRRCLVCGKAENENAVYINEDAAWLCQDCKLKIGKLIGVRTDG